MGSHRPKHFKAMRDIEPSRPLPSARIPSWVIISRSPIFLYLMKSTGCESGISLTTSLMDCVGSGAPHMIDMYTSIGRGNTIAIAVFNGLSSSLTGVFMTPKSKKLNVVFIA